MDTGTVGTPDAAVSASQKTRVLGRQTQSVYAERRALGLVSLIEVESCVDQRRATPVKLAAQRYRHFAKVPCAATLAALLSYGERSMR
jgi:hypothetical protein